MRKFSVLSTLRQRVREFKAYGYDLPASRRQIWKKSGLRGGTVLEVGTGKGHLTALLAAKGLKIVSIDFDEGALKIAKAHLKELGLARRVLFRKINAEKLPFAARSFDHVISADFFHHARKPLRCIREMTRIARKTVTIADLNQNGLRIMDRIHRKEGKKHESPKLPFRQLQKHLRAAGFDVKSHRLACHQIFTAQRRPL